MRKIMRSGTKTKNIRELIPEAPFYPYLPNFEIGGSTGKSLLLLVPAPVVVTLKDKPH
jgi:hypothetical protein